MTNESKGAGRLSFRTVLALVISVILIVAVLTSTAFADNGAASYSVDIADGAKNTTVTTNETEPVQILKNAGIAVNADDKIDLSLFVSGEGGKIAIVRYNTINVDFGGDIKTYGVYATTVGDALTEAKVHVSDQDKMNYALTDPVKDGMVIKIDKAFTVTVTADGKTQTLTVTGGKVQQALKLAKVTLGEDDYVTPAAKEALTPDAAIKVHRVTYKQTKKTEEIDFETKTEKDNTLYEGTKKVAVEGEKGEKTLTYTKRIVDGKEVSNTLTDTTVSKKAVDKVVKVGTKKKPAKPKGADSTPNGVKEKNGYHVGQVIDGRYTHYCACATCNGNSRGITSSGRKISNGMENPYYIACNWLPLGSVINVDGSNYTVVDRGGSGLSSVGRIDIFTPEGHAACYRLGTGSCTIKIVRLGW